MVILEGEEDFLKRKQKKLLFRRLISFVFSFFGLALLNPASCVKIKKEY